MGCVIFTVWKMGFALFMASNRSKQRGSWLWPGFPLLLKTYTGARQEHVKIPQISLIPSQPSPQRETDPKHTLQSKLPPQRGTNTVGHLNFQAVLRQRFGERNCGWFQWIVCAHSLYQQDIDCFAPCPWSPQGIPETSSPSHLCCYNYIFWSHILP